MNEKKYILTEETKSFYGRTLHRIRAVKNFRDIKTGDFGGWIESEENLSQEGTCWIYNEAKVFDKACVYDEAKVFGKACVYDEAEVFGGARVYDEAKVFDKARVFGEARVCGKECVNGKAEVFGKTRVFGEAEICDKMRIDDKKSVFNQTKTHKTTPVLKTSTIEWNTRLCRVKGKTGYFHTWEHYSQPLPASPLVGGEPAGVFSQVFGIVEFKDGVQRVDPTTIVFHDAENDFLNKIDEETRKRIIEGEHP